MLTVIHCGFRFARWICRQLSSSVSQLTKDPRQSSEWMFPPCPQPHPTKPTAKPFFLIVIYLSVCRSSSLWLNLPSSLTLRSPAHHTHKCSGCVPPAAVEREIRSKGLVLLPSTPQCSFFLFAHFSGGRWSIPSSRISSISTTITITSQSSSLPARQADPPVDWLNNRSPLILYALPSPSLRSWCNSRDVIWWGGGSFHGYQDVFLPVREGVPPTRRFLLGFFFFRIGVLLQCRVWHPSGSMTWCEVWV